jgi:hypothetical protein
MEHTSIYTAQRFWCERTDVAGNRHRNRAGCTLPWQARVLNFLDVKLFLYSGEQRKALAIQWGVTFDITRLTFGQTKRSASRNDGHGVLNLKCRHGPHLCSVLCCRPQYTMLVFLIVHDYAVSTDCTSDKALRSSQSVLEPVNITTS